MQKENKKNNCHSREFLSGIPTLDNKIGGDPRLQASGMTAHLNIGQVKPDNQINCHAEKFLFSISTALKTQGEDPEQKRLRMTLFDKSAFTLIELLVVVLIIGILAAVALPQYNKAVQKTRATEVINFVRPLMQSIDRYVLEHGYQDVDLFHIYSDHYTVNDNLDIDISGQLENLEKRFGDDSSSSWGACTSPTNPEGDEVECFFYLIAFDGKSSDVDFHKDLTGQWTCSCSDASAVDCKLYNQVFGCTMSERP